MSAHSLCFPTTQFNEHAAFHKMTTARFLIADNYEMSASKYNTDLCMLH